MPKFFFDIRTPSGVVCLDYQGLDCPDAAAALDEARHGARYVTPGECEHNPTVAKYVFAVSDEAHHRLFDVPFTDIVAAEATKKAGARRPRSARPRARSGHPA